MIKCVLIDLMCILMCSDCDPKVDAALHTSQLTSHHVISGAKMSVTNSSCFKASVKLLTSEGFGGPGASMDVAVAVIPYCWIFFPLELWLS